MTSQHSHFGFHPTNSTLTDAQTEAFVQASGFYNVTPEIKVMENTPMMSNLIGDFVGYDGFSNASFGLFPDGSTDDDLLTTPLPPTLGPLSSSEQSIDPTIFSRNSSESPSSIYHTPLGDLFSPSDIAQLYSGQAMTQGSRAKVTPQDFLSMHPGDAPSFQASPSVTSISPSALHTSGHGEASASYYVPAAPLHLTQAMPTSRVVSPAPSFHTAPTVLSRPGSAYSTRSVQSFHSQRPSLQLVPLFASHSVNDQVHPPFPAANLTATPTLASPTPQRINAASEPSVSTPLSDATLSSSIGPCAATIDPSVIVSTRIAKHTRYGSAPTPASYPPIQDHVILASQSGSTVHAAFCQSNVVGDALSAASCRSGSPAFARSPYHHSEMDESGSSAYSPYTPFVHTRNASIVSNTAHTNYFATTFSGSAGASAPVPHGLGLGGVDPTLLGTHTAAAGATISSPSTRHSTPSWSEVPQYPTEAVDTYGSFWMHATAPAPSKKAGKRETVPRSSKHLPVETRRVSAELTDDEYDNGQEDTDDDYDGEDRKRKRSKNTASGANKRQRMATLDGPSTSYDSECAELPKSMKRKYDSLPKLTKDMRKCPVCPFVPSNKRFSDVQRHWQSHLKEGAQEKLIFVCTLCGDVERDPVTMELVYNNKPGHPKSLKTFYTRKDSVKRHWNTHHRSADPNWQEEFIAIVDAVHPDAVGAKKKTATHGDDEVVELKMVLPLL